MIGSTLSDRAAVSSEGIKADATAVSGLNMNAARLRPGADLREQLKPLASQRGFLKGEAGDVPTRAVEPRDGEAASLLHPGRPSLKHARQPFLAECGPSYATALNYLDLQGA